MSTASKSANKRDARAVGSAKSPSDFNLDQLYFYRPNGDDVRARWERIISR